MNRLEKMKEYLKPYIIKQMRLKILQSKEMPKEPFIKQVRMVLLQALKTQSQFPQWKPSGLILLHLLSGLVTESYEYQILLADQLLYLDERQVTEYWKPALFSEDGQIDIELKKELQKKFVRLTDYELSYIKHWFFYECRGLVEVFWNFCQNDITKLEEFHKLEKDTAFQFFFGDYMGELRVCNYDRKEEE